MWLLSRNLLSGMPVWAVQSPERITLRFGMARPDQAMCVGDLRPISVYSVWWRLWTSCVAKRPTTQTWQTQWLPPECFSGVPSRDVAAAVRALANARTHRPLISKAWIMTCVLRCKNVWGQQHRWITLGETMSQSPVAVIPQGDGLSPLAMNAMMSAAIVGFLENKSSQTFVFKVLTLVRGARSVRLSI